MAEVTIYPHEAGTAAELLALQARLRELESELEAMTGDLVTSQDQVLALSQLARSTRNHLEPAGVLDVIAGQAWQLVECQATLVTLRLPDDALLTAGVPAGSVPTEAAPLFQEQGQRSGCTWLWHVDDGLPRPAWIPSAFGSLLITPIRVRGEVMGAITMVNRSAVPFASPQRLLTEAIAEYAGSHLETVFLYQEFLAQARLRHEMELAAEVQRQLLPRSIPIPRDVGIEIYAASRPARHVGGDFFDVVPAPGGALWLMVGDASGKGVAAALIMAMTRTAVRSRLAAAPAVNPAAVLNGCVVDLYADFSEVGTFATLFLAHFDPCSRVLTWANAGHSPVVYRPRAGGAALLEPDCPPLGATARPMAVDSNLQLQLGDLVVVASDGFSEALDPSGALLGIDRVTAMIDGLGGVSADEVGARLYEQVTDFASGAPRHDDQTLVVLRIVGGN